ncbi:hypothetical protein [Streptomyces griseocarneus]|uniref:hypothetical protein n=1 Tax=Streptomyces griseocarneus TaxID=51201 RepID=UPI00167E7EAD|nr:hypothetical protein [Streptomyces griseocarneus]MBZ6474539.1 hypothetical protein [Streptomyces griseocarneus]GHG67683.1 hypothetical protein GCM10018779_39860 [Streptomyces griseocarneus]
MSTEADAPAPPAAPVYAPPPPVRPPAAGGLRAARRRTAAAVCLFAGLGLIAGAAAGSWLTGGRPEPPAAEAAYERGGTLWRDVPVDELFPRSVHGDAAGPGGARRDWTRIGVAPDGDCRGAFDPPLAEALAPVGCRRLLRATYADVTSSSVTTVGLLVTDTGTAGMRELRERFSAERLDERPGLMPRPYAPRGTVAERFGDAQRASWRISVLTDVPAVVYSVTGFADARTGTPPQPAARAVAPGATTAPAQAGLGHDATALAEQVERIFRQNAHKPGAGSGR